MLEHLIASNDHFVVVEHKVVEQVRSQIVSLHEFINKIIIVLVGVFAGKRSDFVFRTSSMIGEHLKGDYLFGHALLQFIVNERVVDAQAAKYAERLEQLLVVFVERLIVQSIGDARTADNIAVSVANGHAQDSLGFKLPHGVDERIEARVRVGVLQVDLLPG